jgi:CheY-like chemotaxis protein
MNKKILLVDTSNVCLEIEHELLRKLPVKVFYAANGKNALDQARKLRPDLVVMDLDLPEMDGAACCAAIKEDQLLMGTRVVLMTQAVEQKVTVCKIAGCDAIIRKPLDRKEFTSVIRNMLSVNDRLEERIPCRAIVTCRIENSVFCGTLEDVSLKGLFIGSRCEVQVGTRLLVKFALPIVDAASIETFARVIWLNRGKVKRNLQLPVGFGVEFEGLGDKETEQIREFMERSILWERMPSEW